MPEGKAVQSMFSGISGRYDLANRLLSGGVDAYWRSRLVGQVRRHGPETVVDLATGSGDVAFALRRALPPACAIRGLDFCEPMLEKAREKLLRRSPRGPLSFAFGDGMNLPLQSGTVDAVTIAFGLRNFEDRHRGLLEMRRVLKPQRGAVFILEFSQPSALIRPFYRLYLHHVLPTLAKWATGNRSAYEYLGGSIESFPHKDALSEEIRAAGFSEVTALGLTGSIVALHIAQA